MTQRQRELLNEAMDDVTIPMIEGMEYGEELVMNEEVTLYHYSEEDVIVLNLHQEWVEVYQILLGGNEITFEEL